MRLINTLLLFFCLSSLLAQTEQQYIINGHVGTYDSPSKVYLMYRVDGQFVIDTCDMKVGFFSFSGMVDATFFARLILDKEGKGLNSSDDMLELYVDPGTTEITGDNLISAAKITGSPTSDLLSVYQRKQEVFQAQQNQLQAVYLQASPERRASQHFIDSLEQQNAIIRQMDDEMFFSFIADHPNSMMSVSLLEGNVDSQPVTEKIESLYASLSDKVKNTKSGRELGVSIEKSRQLKVGEQAPDFTIKNMHGDSISLSMFRGKYLFINFWSPDCDHCKKEMPEVVEAYHQYIDKNFTILSIAIESQDNLLKWFDAIEDNKMTWTNASDLNGWMSKTARDYRVYDVPFNLLIDPDGKIIAKNIFGDNLKQTLRSFLN